MSPERLIGAGGVRIFTLIAGLAFISSLVLLSSKGSEGWGGGILVVVLGFLTLIGFVHWNERLYARWMKFAEGLHSVVITVLFGICYLFVVPVFFLIVWPFDLLGLRPRSAPNSSWIKRKHPRAEPDSFRRMG